ncbi:folate-binding protein YgfZ, partial [Methylobacterium frigidaeris]
RGLAMLRIDRLGEALAAGETVLAGGRAVEVEKPGFATFAWPV